MSERYNINASTILGDNYNITNIDCSDYNPSIDNTITVTISVNDVYGDPVSDESVTITCTDGGFTGIGNTVITATTSVTGITDSNGEFTLTYTCSAWGLISFAANNTDKQILVSGYKTIMSGSEFNARAYEDRVELRINVASTVFTTSFTAFSGQTVPEGYRPRGSVLGICYNNNDLAVAVTTNGTINRRSMTGSNVTGACDTVISWQY